MTERDYNSELFEKMEAEQDKYRSWLLSQEPREILGHTYEYTMREDIVIWHQSMEVQTVGRSKGAICWSSLVR